MQTHNTRGIVLSAPCASNSSLMVLNAGRTVWLITDGPEYKVQGVNQLTESGRQIGHSQLFTGLSLQHLQHVSNETFHLCPVAQRQYLAVTCSQHLDKKKEQSYAAVKLNSFWMNSEYTRNRGAALSADF